MCLLICHLFHYFYFVNFVNAYQEYFTMASNRQLEKQATKESWDRYHERVLERERGRMSGVAGLTTPPPKVRKQSSTPSALTDDVRPLSTQELIDLVGGKDDTNGPTLKSVKKPRVTPPVTTSSNYHSSATSATTSSSTKFRSKSESPLYALDPTNPSVGDIVLTTVSKVDHHFATKNSVISPNYMLIGRVQYFINVLKSTRPSHPVDEWEEERLGIDWLPIEILGQYRDVTISPVLPSKLTVLVKKESPNLLGLNSFMQEFLHKTFYWDRDDGWKVTGNILMELEKFNSGRG